MKITGSFVSWTICTIYFCGLLSYCCCACVGTLFCEYSTARKVNLQWPVTCRYPSFFLSPCALHTLLIYQCATQVQSWGGSERGRGRADNRPRDRRRLDQSQLRLRGRCPGARRLPVPVDGRRSRGPPALKHRHAAADSQGQQWQSASFWASRLPRDRTGKPAGRRVGSPRQRHGRWRHASL